MTQKHYTRLAGVLLHPTSLYSPYGIGDLGTAAREFIDFLSDAGQTIWQMLPFGPTGYRDSPYQTISAFAGNPILICIDDLVDMELLTKWDIDNALGKTTLGQTIKVEYDAVRALKDPLLQKAYQKFLKLKVTHPLYVQFKEFGEKNKNWLDDFALFYSLKAANNLQSWITWPEQYRNRDEAALTEWRRIHKEDISYYRFLQWLFELQWQQLRDYAHGKHVEIMGDMPIFVAHDSCDVWCHPELFTLFPDGTLEFMAGVPPDYFSKTGQLWGNPLYKWNILEETGFQWMIDRFARMFELFDWIRVDHFRGFEAFWQIPGNEETAINGKWVKAPGEAMFKAVLEKLGNLPIIAEDLGIITPEVEALRDGFEFPGMRVLQFAFGGNAENPHLPHNYMQNGLTYTGTHDNDTFLGWWRSKASQVEKTHFCKYFGINPTADEKIALKTAIGGIYRSIARWAMVPMQDLLEQGSEARMNTPSVPEGNWMYRMPAQVSWDAIGKWLRDLTEMYGRIPSKK